MRLPPYDWTTFLRMDPDSPENTKLREDAKRSGLWTDRDDDKLASWRKKYAEIKKEFYAKDAQ